MSEIYASVDLGGTNIKCVLANGTGQVCCSESIPTQSHEGPEKVLERIADLVQELSESASCVPTALSMSVPGLADLENGVTKFLPNLPTQWRDVPVRQLLSMKADYPVYLLNDVRMATLGELTFGHGKSANTMVLFALGTGIGGGVAVDGKLRLGPWGAAGELGHLTILPDGPQCGCGNRGCLETLASGPSIVGEGIRLLHSGLAPVLHEMVDGDASRVTTKEMAAAAAQGDENVQGAIIRAAQFLGIAVSQTIVTLHPDLVVLGGGVAQIGDLLLDTVRETVRERVRMLPTDEIAIKGSKLGDQAGALGGIALAVKQGSVNA